MSTLFQLARDWLPAQMQVAAGVSVTYSRGAERYTLTAVPGQVSMLAPVEGNAPVRVELSDRDYLIIAADMTDEGLGVPRVGDRVTETIDGADVTFECQRPENGERAWRWSDQQRTVYRIHCKKV